MERAKPLVPQFWTWDESETVLNLFLCLCFALSLSLHDASEVLQKNFVQIHCRTAPWEVYILALCTLQDGSLSEESVW